jgi:hypothetical protein
MTLAEGGGEVKSTLTLIYEEVKHRIFFFLVFTSPKLSFKRCLYFCYLSLLNSVGGGSYSVVEKVLEGHLVPLALPKLRLFQ